VTFLWDAFQGCLLSSPLDQVSWALGDTGILETSKEKRVYETVVIMEE
jgi:hypothetical protein